MKKDKRNTHKRWLDQVKDKPAPSGKVCFKDDRFFSWFIEQEIKNGSNVTDYISQYQRGIYR